MTNKELQDILKKYPDDAEVWIMDKKNYITHIVTPKYGQFKREVNIVPYCKGFNGIVICVDEKFE